MVVESVESRATVEMLAEQMRPLAISFVSHFARSYTDMVRQEPSQAAEWRAWFKPGEMMDPQLRILIITDRTPNGLDAFLPTLAAALDGSIGWAITTEARSRLARHVSDELLYAEGWRPVEPAMAVPDWITRDAAATA